MAAGVAGAFRILVPLVAGRRASRAGQPRPPQSFDWGSQEAPPLQPGSPRSKLPMTLEFSTFFGLCLEKTAPPAADWLRELSHHGFL